MDRALETLVVADITEINRRIIEEFGGFFVEIDDNLLSRGSLEHVLDEIQGAVFGYEPYPTLVEKAAALSWRIIRGHVFHDGNKRTGMESCRLFLDLNKHTMRIDQDVVVMALRIANNEIEFSEFVSWLTERISKRG
jgi:death-on-curing protein